MAQRALNKRLYDQLLVNCLKSSKTRFEICPLRTPDSSTRRPQFAEPMFRFETKGCKNYHRQASRLASKIFQRFDYPDARDLPNPQRELTRRSKLRRSPLCSTSRATS